MSVLTNIILNPYLAAVIVLLNQLGFVYLRTLNVMYTADRKLIPTLVTGTGIGVFWLVSVGIGANAVMNLQWLPIIGYLVGGQMGVLLGFKSSNKLNNLKK